MTPRRPDFVVVGAEKSGTTSLYRYLADHPGIFMPGTFLLGAKYHQQLAEGYSMERAENVGMGLTYETPAGKFTN